MTLPQANPYASPEPAPVVKERLPRVDRTARRDTCIAWAWLLSINLIMPFLFVFIMTNTAGMIGVGLACLVILLSGCYFCWCHLHLARQTLIGLTVVAVTQFFPLLQIAAGVCGLWAVGLLGLKQESAADVPPPPFLDTIASGFVAVLVAGVLLLSIAALLGWLFKSAWSWFNARGA